MDSRNKLFCSTLLCRLSDTRYISIGPIYYEYGSMLITFDNSDNAVHAYDLLRVSLYEDKKLLGKIQIVIEHG